MKKLILIDGNSMIFKAYYATAYALKGKTMIAANGQPTNALRAMAYMVLRLIEERRPDCLLVAFDAGAKTFRHQKMAAYKAGRAQAPQDLKAQFPLVKEFLKLYGVPTYQLVDYEADDIIGTLAAKANKAQYQVEIFSSDKDLLQLVNPKTKVFLTHKGVSQLEEINFANFYQKYQFHPHQAVDIKALVGDSSDNLPGIPGIGPKTAVKLIAQ